jgi:hypothetical protein
MVVKMYFYKQKQLYYIFVTDGMLGYIQDGAEVFATRGSVIIELYFGSTFIDCDVL